MLAPINKVKIGKRIRNEYGDIEGLAASIREHGLLHPIVVDSQHNLVAGGRRLLACERLGLKEIEVRILGELTDRELKVLELEENIKRKELTELERSKALTELAELKRKELEERAKQETEKENAILGGLRPKVGRPDKPTSFEKVAQEIGIPKRTIIDAQKHVDAVNQYPELENEPKYKAIEQARQNNDSRVLDLAQQRKKREEESISQPHQDEDFNAYIDFCGKVANGFNTAIGRVAMLKVDEEHLKAWGEMLPKPDSQGPFGKMIEEYIGYVDVAIPKLLKIKNFLKEEMKK